MTILRRLLGGPCSEVLREWEGRTAVLMGGGPSLTADQVAMVREARARDRIRCIAVNDAYLLAPFADLLYFADAAWWRWHTEGIEKPALNLNAMEVSARFEAFAGERCSLHSSARSVPDERVHFLRNKDYPHHGDGLSLEQDAVVSGKNSGFQALNVAVLAGAKRILLLGYDGGPAINGASHWHGGHPRPPHPAAWKIIRLSFAVAERQIHAAGVLVINCSPSSQIGFRRMALDEALAA